MERTAEDFADGFFRLVMPRDVALDPGRGCSDLAQASPPALELLAVSIARRSALACQRIRTTDAAPLHISRQSHQAAATSFMRASDPIRKPALSLSCCRRNPLPCNFHYGMLWSVSMVNAPAACPAAVASIDTIRDVAGYRQFAN
jgi:hypothetical protein